MFKAKGMKRGAPMIVEYDHGKMLFNGEPDPVYELDLRMELDYCHTIGAYIPYDPEEPINIYSVLSYEFFDGFAEYVETDEKIPTLESEEGAIY